MTDSRKWLEAAVRDLFKDAGYRKRRLTWHRLREETVQVCNFQKSAWGDAFYLNVGIYLRALGPELTPACYKCHVYGRLDFFVPDRSRLHDLLDFTSEVIDPETRRAELRQIVVEHALPWLEARSTATALARALGSHPSRLLYTGTVARYLQGLLSE